MTKGKKHMDGTKRCRIQFGLEAGGSMRAIAKAVGVSLTTVSREISKHTYESFNGCPGMKSCHKRKLVYDACRADGDYRRVLSEHRSVTNAAKLHIARIDPKKVVLKPRLVGIEMK